jgi:hypothetical protein
MYQIHAEGGMPFMAPLTFIFLIIIGLIAFSVLSLIQKKEINQKIFEFIRQLGGFALAWGTFGTIVGLYFAFKSLSEMKETLPMNVIMGGLKVGLITVIYGLIIFMISLAAFVGLRAVNKNSTNKSY